MTIVATVLTVHGIETLFPFRNDAADIAMLQQSLPFTVLKLRGRAGPRDCVDTVATVLTVHGIETVPTVYFTVRLFWKLQQSLPFTVLKHLVGG